MFGSKKKKIQNLMETGTKAVGTITSVQDTGMTINDNPRVALMFTVEPLDGSPPFEASKTVTVSRVRIPQAGQRHPVWFDPEDHQKFAYTYEADAEGRATIVALFGDAFGADGSGVGQFAQAAAAAPADDVASRLAKLDDLLAAGAISVDDHAAQKARILDSI